MQNNMNPEHENRAESAPEPYDYVALHFDEAIGRRWFKIYYRPAVRTLSGKTARFEVLPRWEDPAYGVILPDQFLPAAAADRKLYRLDLYVLECVCRTIHDSKNSCRIGFSLSADTLALSDIHERILFCCSKYSVPHELICIEITEKAIADDILSAERHIRKFHEEGFEVWVDDFGSGSSTLSIATSLKVDGVMIDTAFLPELTDRTRTALEGIVETVKKLGMYTLAKDVRTGDMLEFLHEIGCDLIDGSYYGSPQREEVLTAGDWSEIPAPETPTDHIFYRHLGKAFLPAEDMAKVPSDRPESASAILLISPEGNRFLQASDSFIRLFSEFAGYRWDDGRLPCRNSRKELGTSDGDLPGIRKDISSDGSEDGRILQYILQLAEVCGRTRKPVQFDFAFHRRSGRLLADFLTEYLDRSAFRIRIVDVESYPEADRKKYAEAADICSTCDNVWKLDLKDNHWSSLFGLMENIRILEQVPGRGASNLFAAAYLLPEECEAYMDFVNPDTLEKRITLSESHTVNGFFHMKDQRGRFPLKRISITRFGDDSAHKYLFIVTRNLVGWNDARLYTLANTRRIPSDMSLNFPKQNWLVDHDAVIRAMAGREKLCFFWKDSQRRYMGANEAFLSFFAVTMSDILEKTDEQLEWFLEGWKLRKEEEKLLDKGDTVVDKIVTCSARSAKRRIILTKVPVYERGRIIGIAGYFIDVTAAARIALDAENQIDTDQMTGLLNEKGFAAALDAAEQRYQTEEKDFCVAHFRIRGMRKFRSNFGDELCAELNRQIARVLIDNAPADSDFYHGIGDRFAVLAPAEDIAGMMKIRGDLEKKISAIHTVGESTKVTLYFDSCAVLYSRFLDIGDMLAAAARGMRQYL